MKTLKSQILLWVMTIIIPLLAILCAYNLYTLRILNYQVAVNNQAILSIYEQPVKKDIDYVAYTMANMLANDGDVLQLNYQTSYTEAYICGNGIASKFRTIINSGLDGLGALGISSSENGITRIVYSEEANYSYNEKRAIEKMMGEQIAEEESYRKGWQIATEGERKYLFRILKNNHNHMWILIDFSMIGTPQMEKEKTQDGYMIYTKEDNQPLMMEDFLVNHGIEIKDVEKTYDIVRGGDKRYMIVKKDFPYAGIREYYISPYRGVYQYLDFVQILLLIITLIIAGAIPVGFGYMKRTLFNPLETLTVTMQQIGEGQKDVCMEEEYSIKEFIQMQNSFNVMIDKIKELKISAYERELQLKNIQMQYLQIQIRPHFFLNCLKNIYAMAAQNECRKIEEMIIALSQYLRSMFQSNPTFVSLREEMKGVENYIALQKMCQSKPPECRIDIDKTLLELPIPPLSIITFLENAVKHGAQEDRNLMLSIRASKLVDEETSFLCITILDNGPGFAPDILAGSVSVQGTEEKNHIGIMNVKKRFEMLYQGKAIITLSNSNGACVELYIPIDERSLT